MKTKVLFAVISVVLTATASAENRLVASISYYAQPSLVLATGHGLQTVGGASLAVRANFNARHSIELEMTDFKSEIEERGMRFYPLLLNYKFTMQVAETVSLYAGVSVGPPG